LFADIKNWLIFALAIMLIRAISSVGSEHLVYTQRVGGSNPSSPTKSRNESFGFFYFCKVSKVHLVSVAEIKKQKSHCDFDFCAEASPPGISAANPFFYLNTTFPLFFCEKVSTGSAQLITSSIRIFSNTFPSFVSMLARLDQRS
jgi:hypothetical protein